MFGFSSRRRNARAWIAVAAAYVLALHGILAGLTLSHAAANAAAAGVAPVICQSLAVDATAPGGSEQAPLPKQLSCVLCVGMAAAATLPPCAAVGVSPEPSTVAFVVPVYADPIEVERHTPKLSQGPPCIA